MSEKGNRYKKVGGRRKEKRILLVWALVSQQ